MRVRRALRAAALALACGLAAPAAAQDFAQLAAGSLRLESGNRLVAEGEVEVLWRGSRLRAERLVYVRGLGQAPDRLEILGPILLEEEGGNVVLLADSAELTADLRDGVMAGARLVLDRRLQLAAEEVQREAGRFLRLERAVASSCRICPANPVPLWEIRAARVTHDAETRQLHFEHAAFRVAGRTVAVIPRLRVPDPTVRRMSGFLAPDVASSSRLGLGLRLPYFLALGEDRDLTVTPRLNLRGSGTVEMRYRQAFATGGVELWGALSRDRLRPGQTRGLARLQGDFALAPDTDFGFRLRRPSDRDYADDYGFDGGDEREARLFVEHARRDALGRAELWEIRPDRGARETERAVSLALGRRLVVPGLGGTAHLMLDAVAMERAGAGPVGGAGRRMQRLSGRVEWRRDVLLPGGIAAAALGDVQLDHWSRQAAVADTLPDGGSRVSPAAGLELRWPWVRHDAGGVRHVIEPVAQLVIARRSLPALPNEDSRLVEFDEVTLFRLHRPPGFDAREDGARANLGLSWTRHDPDGWSATLTGGRVLRDRPVAFTGLSGLGGRRSAWLAAATLETATGLSLGGRALVASDGEVPRQDWRLAYAGEALTLAGTLTHMIAEPAEDRPTRTTEIGLDGSWQVSGNWTALADLRYDVAQRQADRVGLGARFRNECLAIDVSLSRRFASSTSLSSQTQVGLTVDLLGFGDRPGGPARPCRP